MSRLVFNAAAKSIIAAMLGLCAVTAAPAETIDPTGWNYALAGDRVAVSDGLKWMVGCQLKRDLTDWLGAVNADRQADAARIAITRCQKVMNIPAQLNVTYTALDADLATLCIRVIPEDPSCVWVLRAQTKIITRGDGHK